MNESKDFFASKTTWGAVVLLAQPLLAKFGIEIDTNALVDSIVLVIGSGLAIWGQFTRKAEIGSIAGVKVK